MRREFFVNRVVDEYNRLLDRMKMATNINILKTSIHVYLGFPATLQMREGRKKCQATPEKSGGRLTSDYFLTLTLIICGPLDHNTLKNDHN